MSFRVTSLRKSFGDNEVLRGVSFQSAPGQIHALLGANGAGKSTLIKCLSGAHAPDSGLIELDVGEVDPGKLSSARGKTGDTERHPWDHSLADQLRVRLVFYLEEPHGHRLCSNWDIVLE